MIASILSTASMANILYENSSLAANEKSLAGIGWMLFLFFVVLALRTIVGKILALFLATTRREISLLDCTAYDENTLDVRVIFDNLSLTSPLIDEATYPQKRTFEWVDTPSEGEFAERLHG